MGNGCCKMPCGDEDGVAARDRTGEARDEEELRGGIELSAARKLRLLRNIGGAAADDTDPFGAAAGHTLSDAGSEGGSDIGSAVSTVPDHDNPIKAPLEAGAAPWAALICHDSEFSCYKSVVGQSFTVGRCRRSTNHVVNNALVSKIHFALYYMGKEATVEGISNTNGTRVAGANGKGEDVLVGGRKRLLSHGDTITIKVQSKKAWKAKPKDGATREIRFRFMRVDGEEAPATTPSPVPSPSARPATAPAVANHPGRSKLQRDRTPHCSGATAKVYKGEMMLNVAVKEVDARRGETSNEIRILEKLSHPHVVRYYGHELSTCGSMYNIVLGLAKYTISHQITDVHKGPLPDHKIRSYTAQVTEGLAYLHAQFIYHMDIKGANVLVHEDGTCQITDFGHSTDMATAKRPCGQAGTPRWMSPEIAKGGRHSDRADIWSLGCLVTEMVNGAWPWEEKEFLTGQDGIVQCLYFLCARLQPGTQPKLGVRGGVSMACRGFVQDCFAYRSEDRPSARDLLQYQYLKHTAAGGGPADAVVPADAIDITIAPATTATASSGSKSMAYVMRTLSEPCTSADTTLLMSAPTTPPSSPPPVRPLAAPLAAAVHADPERGPAVLLQAHADPEKSIPVPMPPTTPHQRVGIDAAAFARKRHQALKHTQSSLLRPL
eukprot:TRINITY_DN1080_c1_g1_i1.p1 TRINITY_DN1080_c1_g1~~TRINITY_DN1080_c1_g1_i1.p1  ORF type:complete len:662 (+),score=238.63 TRINITY_DN1080_c1_g1_i1:128-2113(+)